MNFEEKPNIIKDKSYAFALRMIKLYRFLTIESKEYVLSKQVLRSGTAIGALVFESEHAQSTADFISKLSISLKEANETKYWLMLLKDSGYIQKNLFNSFFADLSEILKILISIINTTKRK